MASRARNLWTLLSNSRIRPAYLKWQLSRLRGKAPAVELPGGAVAVATHKFNDFCALYFQHPSENEFEVYRRLLSPGGLFVDVGANMGLTTILAWKTALATRIIAFEPTHRYAEVWHRNISRNGIKNATLIQCAIGDRSGTMEFIVNPKSPLNNRLLLGDTLNRYEPMHGDKFSAAPIGVARLDEILPACGVDKVQLLKIDVEGAEPAILRGAEKLLARRGIKNLLLEFIPEFMQEMGEPIDRYIDYLICYGFRFRAIEAGGSLERILSKDDLMHRRFDGLNIIAELIE